MSDVLVLVGSGIAILLGIVHFASTKTALQGFKGLPVNEAGMVHAMWQCASGFYRAEEGAEPLLRLSSKLSTDTQLTVNGYAILPS